MILPFIALFGMGQLPNDNWPQFRGPSGNGISHCTGTPLKWSEIQNVRWKTPIHDKGWSSPVVWGGRIWITSASEDGKRSYVFCVDRASGKILLDRKLFDNPNPEPLGNDVNGYASPTCAIEPGRVYVHFGSYGTACLDTKSFNVLWERRDLPCRHYRGPGSSVIIFGDLLILTMDGVDVQYMAALNKKTGKTVWKTDRTAEWDDLGPDGKPQSEGDLRKAYCTPLVVNVNGQIQLVIAGSRAFYGYDPLTGKEIWKVRHKGFSNAAMPVANSEMAFLCTCAGQNGIWAVRLGGHGDITDTHVAWRYNRMFGLKPSPILVDGLIFAVNDSGVATCLEARTGEVVWQERLGGQYSASPVFADGRIYFCSEQGKTTVIKPGRKLEILAENILPDGFMACPAVSGKSLILRTRTALYRIDGP